MFSYRWKLNDLENVKPNGYKVFSCFAGGGGSSMGYKMAGYDVIGCNEIDTRQMDIYKTNLKPKYSYLEDIRTFRLREDLPKELYELDILDASFPCSLFSAANLTADKKKGKKVKFREGQKEQVLDDLAFETIKLANKLKPKIVVFENVKGLLQEKNKWYVEQIYKQFSDIGYKITHKLISMVDMGVPQKRQRVFFFATRLNVKTTDLFSEEPLLKLDFQEKPIYFKEIYDNSCIDNPLPDGFLEVWQHRQSGDKDFSCTNGRWINKPNKFFNQNYLYKNKVCNTLTAKLDGNVLFDEPRYLNDSERILIGTFPQDYKCSKDNLAFVIGMSVPPLAMYKISKEIQKQWLDNMK